ncbi:hypothetical protein ACS0TY_013304 [Phlomoides rotata]
MANEDSTAPAPHSTTTPLSSVTEVGQTFAPQVVAPQFVTSDSRPFMVHSEKPEKFSGVASSFKRWQQKMQFYLTTLHLAQFLMEDPLVVDESDTDTARRVAYDQWGHKDFLCRNYVLGGLVDSLYNVYHKARTAKELWNSLESKHLADNACIKSCT